MSARKHYPRRKDVLHDETKRHAVRTYAEIAAEMKRRHNVTLSRARVYQLLMSAESKLRRGLNAMLETR